MAQPMSMEEVTAFNHKLQKALKATQTKLKEVQSDHAVLLSKSGDEGVFTLLSEYKKRVSLLEQTVEKLKQRDEAKLLTLKQNAEEESAHWKLQAIAHLDRVQVLQGEIDAQQETLARRNDALREQQTRIAELEEQLRQQQTSATAPAPVATPSVAAFSAPAGAEESDAVCDACAGLQSQLTAAVAEAAQLREEVSRVSLAAEKKTSSIFEELRRALEQKAAAEAEAQELARSRKTMEAALASLEMERAAQNANPATNEPMRQLAQRLKESELVMEQQRLEAAAAKEAHQAEIKKLTDKLEKAVSKILEHKDAHERFVQENAELKKTLAATKEKATHELKSKFSMLEQLEHECTGLRESLARVTAERNKEKDMNEKRSHEEEERKEAMARLQERLRDMEGQLDESKAEIQQQRDLLEREQEERLREREEAEREKEALNRIRDQELVERDREWERKFEDVKTELSGTADSSRAVEEELRAELAGVSHRAQQLAALKAQAESKARALQEELEKAIDSINDAEHNLKRERQVCLERGEEIGKLLKEREELTVKQEERLNEIERRNNEKYERLLRELREHREQAGKLISESEAKLQEAETRARQLESEMAADPVSEHRLVQLAQQQAERDQYHQRTDQEIQDLKDKIVEYEEVIRKHQNERTFFAEEIARLNRARTRSRVNLDYLKNILVRFIQFDTKEDERKALYPVIATILQFEPEDIEQIRSKVDPEKPADNSWWSAVTSVFTGSTAAPATPQRALPRLGSHLLAPQTEPARVATSRHDRSAIVLKLEDDSDIAEEEYEGVGSGPYHAHFPASVGSARMHGRSPSVASVGSNGSAGSHGGGRNRQDRAGPTPVSAPPARASTPSVGASLAAAATAPP